MPKAERKKQMLHLLADSELALPPRVIYENLVMAGATYSYKTVHRHLQESLEDGLVEHPDRKDSYYQITKKGRSFLAKDLDEDEVMES